MATVKFTKEVSAEQIAFLDVKVFIIDGTLETDMYFKLRVTQLPVVQFRTTAAMQKRHPIQPIPKNKETVFNHFHRRNFPEDLILDVAILS